MEANGGGMSIIGGGGEEVAGSSNGMSSGCGSDVEQCLTGLLGESRENHTCPPAVLGGEKFAAAACELD